LCEDLVDPVVVAADAEVARLDAQHFAHREEGIEDELLRHHAEVAAGVAVVGDDVVPHDRERARCRPHQTGQGRDQRGLARTVGAEQAEELALATSRSTPARACRAVVLADTDNADRRRFMQGERLSGPAAAGVDVVERREADQRRLGGLRMVRRAGRIAGAAHPVEQQRQRGGIRGWRPPDRSTTRSPARAHAAGPRRDRRRVAMVSAPGRE
jgi:hypothetical protein